MHSRRSSTLPVSFASCETDERHRNRECFLSQPLKCFTLSSGAGESATSGKNLNDLSHTGPARRKPCLVESSAE